MRAHVCAAVIALSIPGAAFAGDVTRAPYGVTKDGAQVEAFTLTNTKGASARILSYGGVIDEVRVPDRNGKLANVVVGLPDLAAYEANPSLDAVIGRYANRIAGGGFTLDGVRYDLAAGPNGVAMHGGPRSMSSRVWSATTSKTETASAVTLAYTSPDGENGYPGTLSVTVTYTLDDDNALTLDYRATTDKPTVVNLTNHAYWNLVGDARRDVYDHQLQVFSDQYTPADKTQIPTGEIASVEGTPFDLRKPVRIGDRITSAHPQMLIGRGYDHNFVLKPQPGGAPAPAAHVSEPTTGRVLDVSTTEPGVQVYTGNGFSGGLVGAGGGTLRQGYGLALETEHYPDSPNKPNFPSTVLRPGEEFHSTTVFRFSTER